MKLARPLQHRPKQTRKDNARRRRRPFKKIWRALPAVCVGHSASAIAVSLTLITLACTLGSVGSVACTGISYGLELAGMYPWRSCGGTVQKAVGNLQIQIQTHCQMEYLSLEECNGRAPKAQAAASRLLAKPSAGLRPPSWGNFFETIVSPIRVLSAYIPRSRRVLAP